jgi:hypothetical protein
MITVPMQRGGAKSLPAELKVGGHNPMMRLRASSPGYGMGGLRGLRGLGQECDDNDTSGCDGSPIDIGTTTPVAVDLPVYTPSTIDTTTPDLSALSATIPTNLLASLPQGYTGPTIVAPGTATPAAPSGYQWATMVNQTGATLAKVLTVAQGGTAVTLPNGTQLLYGSPAAAASAGTTGITSLLSSTVGGVSMGTILIVGALGFLLISMGGKK